LKFDYLGVGCPPRATASGVVPQHAVVLENSFFDIVDVEEELHFARRMAELRDVGFEIFLDLRREIAEAHATHLVVPFDDRSLGKESGVDLVMRAFSFPISAAARR
jgi:hypothetical protein